MSFLYSFVVVGGGDFVSKTIPPKGDFTLSALVIQ